MRSSLSTCIKCSAKTFSIIPATAPITICDKCWISGSIQAAKDHILACQDGCQKRGGSLIAECEAGLKLLDAYFQAIAR